MNRNRLLFDVHAHLDGVEELEKAIAEARSQGVSAIIGVGMGLESNRRIIEISENYPGYVFPAIGYHPWEIDQQEITETITYIEKNVERCIAIGEVGLDYKVKVKKELQREVFREIAKLSPLHDKPLLLHCRYSHQRVLNMISDMGVEKAVFHWYVGSMELLREIVGSGYYVSATPALSYSPPHQEAILEAPLESILLETDCPVSYQGKVSRPVDVRTTLKEVAKIKNLSPEKVAESTSRNAIRLFGTLLSPKASNAG